MKRSFENISAGLNESVSINAASPEDSMLKGDVDSSLTTASFTNNCLVDAQSLIELFRCVDTILVSLRSKRISPQFSEVKVAVESLCQLVFDMSSLALMLTICPQSYKLEWIPQGERLDGTSIITYSLAIYINSSWPKLTPRISISTRLIAFSEAARSLASFPPSVNQDEVIPPRPQCVLNRSSASVIEIYNKSAAVKLQNQISLNDATIPGLSRIDALREAVQAKRQKQLAIEASHISSQIDIERMERLKSLPKMCDMLRILFNRRRKTTAAFPELLNKLSQETKLSVDEVKRRILLLCDLVPDFLLILPADDICWDECVKLNGHCNYESCLDRLRQLILSS